VRKPTAAIAAIAATFLLLTGAAPASAATVEDPVSLGVVGDSGTSSYESVALGDLVYFVVDLGYGNGNEVWYTDGAAASRIATFERAEDLVVFDGAVYLGARQDATHDGLWRVTTTGVTLVSAHDGTGVQPAVEDLVAGDSALFYYTWSGESADNTIVWSWAGGTATEVFEAQSINDVYAVGESVVFVGGDSDVGWGLRWWKPGTTVVWDSSIDYVDDLVVLGDTAIMFADGDPDYGLWTWTAADGLDFIEDLDYGNEFFELDDRIIVSGESDTHDGLWSWDGTTLTAVSHEFPNSIYSLDALGDSVYFWGDDGTDAGLWELDGTTASFLRAVPEPDYFRSFGDATMLVTGCCDPAPLYVWDGTDTDPVLVTDDWNYISELRVADSYALVLAANSDGELEAWVLKADSLASLELTPSSTTIVAGSSVTFTVEGFDSEGGSLGDMTSAATFTSVPAATSVSGATLAFETAGTYEVTASIGSVSDEATVVVTPAALSTIELGTTATGLIAGDAADFTVEGFDAHGNSLGDLTSSATFSTDPAGTSITGSEITFEEAGSFEVTADVGGHQDQLVLQVDPGDVESIELRFGATTVAVGGQLTFTVSGLNANGVAIDDLTASAVVESDDPTDEIVGNTITFPHASPHEITATVGQLQDVVVIEVTPAELGSTGAESWWLGALAAVLLAGAGTLLLRSRRRA
jgi:LPXTG-motif cell wall-anchored protein